MKIIRVPVPGDPGAMRLDELPTPQPGPGQARVRVHAAGVNFIDVYHRTGLYPGELPIVLGREGAGVVESLGAGVSNLSVGDRVAWTNVAGSYATHVIAPAERLVPLPEALSFRDGAAAMLQGMTAHYLTQSTVQLSAGDTVLVHAAAGGVGRLLCQLAHRAGCRVIGTAGTPAKAEAARAHGADEMILYEEVDFEDEVRRLTNGAGVSVVYDSVGRATFDRSLRCLSPRSTMVLFGQSSGPVPPFDPQLLNKLGSLYLTRPTLFHYTATRAELLARAGDVLGWVADGELRLSIDEELPLERAADAHRKLEARQTSGKLLLIPS